MKKNKNLHIRIDEELAERFEAVTRKRSVNKSELLRSWILEFVKFAEAECKFYAEYINFYPREGEGK